MKTPAKIIFVIAAKFALIGLFLAALVKTSNESTQRAEREIVQEQRENEEAIKQRHVLIGMTTAQVRQAWGEPKRMTRAMEERAMREEWSYGNSERPVQLYFVNGVLKSGTRTDGK